MYQQWMAVGNLGSDVELRYTPSGVPVATFNLAVNRSWVNADGQRQDKTLWARVTCWRKLGETVAEHLAKGRQVMVVGEIEEARAYTDREGNARASLEVTAQTVRFLGQRGDSQAQASTGNSEQPASGNMPDEGDIPF